MPDRTEENPGFSSGVHTIDKSCAGERPSTPRPLPQDSDLTLTAQIDSIRRAIAQNTAALRAVTRALSRRPPDSDLSA